MQATPLLGDALNVHDLETFARERLPETTRGYYASGGWDEVTLRENREAYERIRVHYRCMVDVSKRQMATTVLGTPTAMPILVAPTAFHKLACPEGELATVRAAGALGTIMTLSSLSTTKLEEVAAAATAPVWFQLYINQDRGFTRELVARAEAAGYKALQLTVDTPEWGKRERDVRNGFHLPDGIGAVNLERSNAESATLEHSGRGMGQAFSWMIDASLTWKDIDWLCGLTKLPIILKGICRPDDAEHAIQHGAKGILVSNHGGRQMDTAPATVEVLPEIAQQVAGRVPVLLDGGIRRGVDVLKALALGASAVQVGRPILWGLACGGEAGAKAALEFLRSEFDLAMALAGCPDLQSITPDLVRVGHPVIPPVSSPR